MSLVIQGGRVIDPAHGVDRPADVLIEEGRIARVGCGIRGAARVIDATGRLVLPGLVDLQTRLGEPGYEYKEDLRSGTAAATAGGFTSLCVMPGTRPVNDRRPVTEHLLRRAAQDAICRIFPVAAATEGLEGQRLCEYADLRQAGIVAVCDVDRTVLDAGVFRRVLEYAATFDLPVLAHCEDRRLAAGGAMHEGLVATRAGIPGIPAQAESAIVARDLELVELTGARYHAQHLSTAQSVRHLRRAKQAGLPVSAEVSALHLLLCDDVCRSYDSRAKITPPLRSAEHRAALLEGLADGTIDAIVSDHHPQTVLEKELEFGLAACGASTLETTLAVVLGLVEGGVLTMMRAVALLTNQPAQVLGLAAGTLGVGALADVTIVDPTLRFTVEGAAFRSKSHFTPLEGRELCGAAMVTLVGGRVVHERAPARG